jgi:hypothetical protein
MRPSGGFVKLAAIIAAFVVASAWTVKTEAALIKVDYPAYELRDGTPGVVLDTDTGREWLNTLSVMSWGTASTDVYHEFMATLMPGQRYSGWSIASSTEVLELMADAGLPNMVGVDTTGQYAQITHEFQHFLGHMWDGSNYYATWGLVNDTLPNGGLAYMEVGTTERYKLLPGRDPGNPEDYFLTYDCYFSGVLPASEDFFNDSWNFGPYPLSAWLVRDAQPVPEPSTVMLCATGLVAITAFRKQRKSS